MWPRATKFIKLKRRISIFGLRERIYQWLCVFMVMIFRGGLLELYGVPCVRPDETWRFRLCQLNIQASRPIGSLFGPPPSTVHHHGIPNIVAFILSEASHWEHMHTKGGLCRRLHMHPWRRWVGIGKKWKSKQAKCRCIENTHPGSRYVTNGWFWECQCQPGSEYFNRRSTDGLGLSTQIQMSAPGSKRSSNSTP